MGWRDEWRAAFSLATVREQLKAEIKLLEERRDALEVQVQSATEALRIARDANRERNGE